MAITRLRFSELTSSRIVGTILDRSGNLISGAALSAATLTLYDLLTATGGSPDPSIINGRDAQDVLGVGSPPEQNGVTIYDSPQTDTDGSTYNFEWLLSPEDNVIVTERRQIERHRAMFHFVWPDGEMRAEFEIEVVNLRKAH